MDRATSVAREFSRPFEGELLGDHTVEIAECGVARVICRVTGASCPGRRVSSNARRAVSKRRRPDFADAQMQRPALQGVQPCCPGAVVDERIPKNPFTARGAVADRRSFAFVRLSMGQECLPAFPHGPGLSR